jgi:hypothetical protein
MSSPSLPSGLSLPEYELDGLLPRLEPRELLLALPFGFFVALLSDCRDFDADLDIDLEEERSSRLSFEFIETERRES